jgi:hypothetical protein
MNTKTGVFAEDFPICSIVFADNTLYHQDGNYFFMSTTSSRVIQCPTGESNKLWVELSDDVCDFIESIDLRYVSEHSSSLTEYLRLISDFHPSLKQSPSGKICMLPVNIRSYTKIQGQLIKNKHIALVLQANYSKNTLIWNAYHVKGTNVESEIIFPNCLLEPKLIKI